MSSNPSVRIAINGQEYIFDPSRSRTVGRQAESDILVADPSVSRHHGELRPEAAGWYYQDAGSTRGTFLDGQQVSRVPISKPVTLRLGNPESGPMIEISLVVASPPSSTRVPAPPPPGPAPPLPPPPLPPPPSSSGPAPLPPWGPVSPRSPTPTGLGSAELRGPQSVYRPQSPNVRIGRAVDNDIVIPDMMVSRHHAEVRIMGGAREIVDLGSENGIFVDGKRVRAAPVNERSIITVGRHTFRLNGDQLEEYVDTGEITFDANDLAFQLPNGKKILDGITFPLEPSSFLAIMGPTGAGKSTLAKALTGFQPATSGSVLYNGRDLYRAYDELRRRIGYVPQDDILHAQLTVARALEFGAELRFPPDVSADERRGRVAEVMDELGLREQASTAIQNLSGGQRKRTSVALELLTKPSLLFLDEPTSGLDPGYEKSVMKLLRDLSDAGRSVIVITHSVQSLDLCDRLLFLARGGFMAYFGPPKEALGYFGAPDYPEVFRQLESRPGPDVREEFKANPAYSKYVRKPLAARPAIPPASPDGGQPTSAGTPTKSRPASDLQVLIRRYAAVITADRRNLRLLIAQAPLIALLVVALAPSGSLTPGSKARGSASTVLLALSLGAAFIGLSNSIREIVKELPVYRRERAVGLSIWAYLGSKAIVLGVITVMQAILLVTIGTLRQTRLGPGVLGFGPPKLEFLLAVILTGLAAMSLGLLVSAFVTNADKALTLLPVILLALFLLSGPLFKLTNRPVLRELSYVTATRWGFSALASTSDLRGMGGCSPGDCEASWHHSVGTWSGDMMFLVLLTILPLALAGGALQRQDPLRAWRSRHRAGRS